MRGDDEKDTGERERETRDDRPTGAELELGDLCGGEPDPSEQDEQESDLREFHARLVREGKLSRDDEVVVFNTGAAQKYPEAVKLDLPRLDKNKPIDYERLIV